MKTKKELVNKLQRLNMEMDYYIEMLWQMEAMNRDIKTIKSFKNK